MRDNPGRFVSCEDPDYPLADYRKGGTVVIELEVIFDGDGERVAEDAATAARRHLQDLGCDIPGGTHAYEPGAMWLNAARRGG